MKTFEEQVNARMAIKLRQLIAEISAVLKEDPSLASCARTIDDLVQTVGHRLGAPDEPTKHMQIMGALYAVRVIALTLVRNPMLDSAALLIQLENTSEQLLAKVAKGNDHE